MENKLASKELSELGNVAQIEFCGKLEIALDKVKLAIISKCDTNLEIEAVQEAKDLIAKRKRKSE